MRRLIVLPCLLVCLASGVARAQQLYIPPGQEAQVQALLSPVAFHQPLSDGWLLTGIAIEGATVSLAFTGPAAASAKVVLHHPANGVEGTPVGPLVLVGKAPAPVLEALQQALEAKPATMLPWRPARSLVPTPVAAVAASSSPRSPVPWLRWVPFLLLAVCLGWLAVRYRRHATRWALIALPAVTLAGLMVRVLFSPRTMLHEYYHAGDHLLGYLFPQVGQRFFYGDTGPTLYALANALWGGDEQAVFTTNLVLSVLTIPALAVFDYVLFRDWKRATFTASLFALLPLNVRFAASEDLSNPGVLLGTLALTLGVVFVQRGGFVAAIGAALATSLTMQTRPELMLWPLAVLFVALAASRVGQWSRLLSIPASVAALVLLVTALPQALHLMSLPPAERLYGGIFQKPDLIAFLDPKAVPPVLLLMALVGLAWGLRRRAGLAVALFVVAAGGAHVSLTFFLNPPPYNLRTQMITVPTLLVLCGCVLPLLRERLTKLPALARVAPGALVLATAVWSSTSVAWVRQVGDAQQEFDFLVRTVPRLPGAPGSLLTVVGGHEGGGRVGMFPTHLLARAGSALVPHALPGASPNATWPAADGSTLFYQGMYCYSFFKDEPPAAPMTPRCSRVHEHYVLEPLFTEEIAGPGYSPMEYAPPPYLIGFYRAVSRREVSAPSVAVPPEP